MGINIKASIANNKDTIITMQIDLTQNFGQYLNPQARNIEEYEVFCDVYCPV